MDEDESLDISALRERLQNRTGRDYWQSLQELAETDEFEEFLHREFPEGASEWNDPTGRRRFLRLMGASLAVAGVGLSGCGESPKEAIVPYVDPPEEVIPGKPLFFATSFPLAGYAQGLIAESHMGRPTKIEGNPDHPASLGGTNTFMQGSVLDLYDPDRSENVLHRGAISTGTAFVQALQQERQRWQQTGGRGLRVLTGRVTSPTLAAQLRTLLDTFPNAQWHQYEPTARDAEREGIRRAHGQYRQTVYRFDEAEVVFSVDDDFLLTRPGSVRYARDFAERRRVREGETAMNRLYVTESSSTITGGMADHRLPARPSEIEAIVRAVAQRLGLEGGKKATDLSADRSEWVDALASDLEAHRGAALVTAGPAMPTSVHALVHRMNEALGAVGASVEYIEPVEARPENHHASLRVLTDDMAAGEVDTLAILGGNPAYTAPADVPFARHLRDVPTSVHLSLTVDATSRECVWHVPKRHYLETWSDARAFDGTAGIIQPLIGKLFESCRSPHEVLAVLNGRSGTSSHVLVRQYWQEQYTGDRFEAFWEQSLKDGVVPGTGIFADEADASVRIGGIRFDNLDERHRPEPLQLDRQAANTSSGADTTQAPPADPSGAAAAPATSEGDTVEEGTVEVVFRPDPTLWDGRFANNGWLQELPKPITKLVWDNAALIGPDTAERFDLHNRDMVELQHDEQAVTAGVWIVPGHPDGTATLYLGHGRPQAGRVGDGVGFDAYALRSSRSPWTLSGVSLRKTGETYNLVSTQHHHSMEGRELVREAPIERFRENPDFATEDHSEELPSLYPEDEPPGLYPEPDEEGYEGYEWGMSIDTNTCIGCNACITACQAENNIPVVGKEQVEAGREMHWLRVDRYFKGDLDNPDTYFQPVPCMHCENAPCEVVCPVAATVHNDAGLNVMVYNRCIGTRYCSNNCPYKVRRFNFLEWNENGWDDDWDQELGKLQHNPDVTVRSRGVMEKCTYCQQRINAARIRAEKEDREIRDGEMMTACQTACPTDAIVFGDINDDTQVKQLKEEPHNYGLLAELGTRPRTTYLAHFHNPNAEVPKLEPKGRYIGDKEKIEVEVGADDLEVLDDST